MRTNEQLIDLLSGRNADGSGILGRLSHRVGLSRAEFRRLERAGLITHHGTSKTMHLTKQGRAIRDRARTANGQEARP